MISSKSVNGQNAFFNQWETVPMLVNPALTGNFEGKLKFRATYRDEAVPYRQNDFTKTTATSLEYKLPIGNACKLNVGFNGSHELKGLFGMTNTSYNIAASVVQSLGNLESSHHEISLGFNAGMVTRKIDFDIATWLTEGPDGPLPEEILKPNFRFADLSAGLNWSYVTTNHFSIQVGSAFHHLNKPNTSFNKAVNRDLTIRFNLHGNVEIPMDKNMSLVPSLFFNQFGDTEQLLYGLSGKWYFKSADTNFIQLGILTKTAFYDDDRRNNTYIIATSVSINSIQFGISYDRLQEGFRRAFEFSVGYTIGRDLSKSNKSKKTKN